MAFDMYNWKDAFFPLVTKWFDLEYNKNTNIIEQLINVTDTKRAVFWEHGVGGVGEIPDYDGTTLNELSKKKGFKTVYETKEKAGVYRLKFKDVKFDMSGEAKKAGQDMSNALYMTVLMDFYRFFANGFNSDYKGADGKALFAADHPVNNEAGNTDTYCNYGTDTFSISAITKAQAAARRYKTYDGLPFLCKFDVVLVSPELESKAKEYFGSEAKLLPDSPNNNANPVYQTKYFVIDGFGAKQWAVGDSRLMKRFMNLVHGTRPMVIDQKAANPLISEFIPYMDYTLGWSEPRCIYGFDPK
jgi:hypothetical protein